MKGDRAAGAVTMALAAAVAGWSLTFSTTFPTDPLGPRAVPLLAAVLLGGGGAWMFVRPHDRPMTQSPMPHSVWLGAASFVAYALLLETLGFFTATLAEFVVLATFFGGRPIRTALAGIVLVGLLYGLFVQALSLPLPVGSLWVIGD